MACVPDNAASVTTLSRSFFIGRPPKNDDNRKLVLSRKLGEKIYVGDNVCITVVDVDRGKIRLGIEAPRDVPIYRHELPPPEAPESK